MISNKVNVEQVAAFQLVSHQVTSKFKRHKFKISSHIYENKEISRK